MNKLKNNTWLKFISCLVLFFGAGLTLTLLTPIKPSLKPQLSAKAQYHLVFSDEFNKTSLNKEQWNTCYETYRQSYNGCTNYGNNESEWYVPSQVSVRGGNLILSADRKNTQGDTKYNTTKTYTYASGMVSSGRFIYQTPAKWSGTYGYYETRMKVPSGQAIWPAFWLLPINHRWPPEIDTMELLGNKPNQVLQTYFWPNISSGSSKDSSVYTTTTSLANSWHTYAVDWEKNTIDWYIDGHLTKHVASSNVPDTPMQIIFDLAVGGDLPGQPDSTTPTHSEMAVDYVRVYQK